jgi:signal peptidase I
VRKFIYETLFVVLIVAALFIGLRLTIQTCIVDGPSMENTFQNGERILVNELAYKFNAPQTGDVVIFHPPFSSTAPFIKRIVGLPGERVEILNGTVKIIKPDDSIVTLTEPYIKETPDYNYTSPVITPKEYFGLGDNRNNNEDSHYGWLVSRNEIIGKAWLCIWPPKSWGLADNYHQPTAVPGGAVIIEKFTMSMTKNIQ